MPFHSDPAHDTRKADSIGAEVQRNEAERIRVDEMSARRNAVRPDVRSALRDEISAQLGPAAAELMIALKPTCELRWIDRGRDYMRSLQQRWACALTGKNEWRDVPVAREGEQ
jgi:hypothetical protein